MEQINNTARVSYEYLEEHKVAVACTLTAACALWALRRYSQGGVCRSTVKLHNLTVLITGSNTGIGKETAKDLAGRGARVILACRDMKRANEAADDIKRSTGNSNVVVYKLDLSSLKSVRACAKEVLEKEDRLDILVNNAGVMWTPQWKTEDGLELQMGTNHLGHFLFTNLLLDLIKKSAPSRIVTVSSLGHTFVKHLDLDDLNSEKSYSPVMAYSQSKLANILFTRELSRRLKGTGVVTASLHPGAVATELLRYINEYNICIRIPVLIFYHAFFKFFCKTPTAGAQTSLHCALAPEVERQSGKYFSDCAVKDPSKLAQDDELAAKLWTVSEKMVGLAD
ncbi:retinol dehydrogenase 12-like [Dreissena polymorpha]|uniref:Uncharacterized protein n=1 Tax=Dreissena polymorpha TaxID=45954 RepID=A0A9D4LBE4_DREPO|nr:retinol dehydrogenase 12-like [Dreissena polymorpha]KAH3855036.1 hypothetical protein DPMN_097596 [Dreissena polymorpha]